MRYASEPCQEDHAFRFAHGPRARSLEEFRGILSAAPPEVVFEHRLHFHPWVHDILEDAYLAERLRYEGERARDGEHLRRSAETLVDRALREAKAAVPTRAGRSAMLGR
jgi:hypothetical protein